MKGSASYCTVYIELHMDGAWVILPVVKGNHPISPACLSVG